MALFFLAPVPCRMDYTFQIRRRRLQTLAANMSPAVESPAKVLKMDAPKSSFQSSSSSADMAAGKEASAPQAIPARKAATVGRLF